MWDFLKIYFKESWLIVYHSPHIDIPIPKGEKIKLLGDSSIFTRTLQKLETLCTNFSIPSFTCNWGLQKHKTCKCRKFHGMYILNEVLFQGSKWKIVYISGKGGRAARKLVSHVTTSNTKSVKR